MIDLTYLNMDTSCFLVSSPSRLKAGQRNIRLVPLKISVVNVVSKCLFASLPLREDLLQEKRGRKRNSHRIKPTSIHLMISDDNDALISAGISILKSYM